MIAQAWTARASLRWAFAIAGGFSGMALFLFVFIYWQTAWHERNRIDMLVTQQAARIAGDPDHAVELLRAWLNMDLHDVRYGAVFAPDGSPQAGNLQMPPAGLPPDRRVHRSVLRQFARDHDQDKGQAEVVRGVAWVLPSGRLLVVAYDIDQLAEVQNVILRGLGFALLPALALSLLSGVLLASRAQRRIAAVHQAVGRIMQGHLRERLPVRGNMDDIDKVATAVNGMLGRIEQLIEESRGIGDSIAHDLRTPLTRLRARLERSRDATHTRAEFQAAVDHAIAAVDQALAVVAAVLRIGAIEHGHRQAAFAPVSLAEILRDAAELYEPFAEERGMRLLIQIADADPVRGDRDLLLEAVGNLVDNALKFAPAGTDVVLTLTADDAGTRLSVTDEGPGIPATERARVLQRFYRLDKSRATAGSGLGLSLVAAIATLHGFQLRIDGAPGCTIEILCDARSAGLAMIASGVPDAVAVG